MARSSIWKVISDAGLGSEPQVAGLLRWASDTNRLYIHDGTAYKNVNLTHKGLWSGSTAYKQFDTVTYQGAAWRALRNNIGITPVEGADWTLFVSKGDQGIQGTQGTQGNAGATGAQGANATTTTTASFVQPASGATVSVTVADTSWMASGQELYVVGGGYYGVSSITDATHVVLTNRGYSGNAAVGATVASSARVSPAGLQGPATLGISTQPQTDAGTDDTTAVSPLKLYNANVLQLSRTEVSVTGAATPASHTFGAMHVLSGGSDYTRGLPALSGNVGKVLGFRVDSGAAAARAFTLDGNGAETIDGQQVVVMRQNDVRVLFATSSGWVTLDKHFGQNPRVVLDYRAATDLHTGTAVGANTWVNLGPQHSFALDQTASLVAVKVGGGVVLGNVASIATVASQAFLDGATQYHLGSAQAAVSSYNNPLSGSQDIPILGLAAGSHTLQIRVSSQQSASLYCRASTNSMFESLYVQVWEHRF